MRWCLTILLAALAVACSNIEEAAPRPKPSSTIARPTFEIEVDPILRGTIASEAILLGFNDVVVRGYGIVVGLKGTGSRTMPAEVRAFLLQELSRREISDTVKGMGVSPERFLNSDDIAAVVIEGIIPAGSTHDTRFDVRVMAVPGSGTTSLEGGRLWTAELRPGPLLAGSRQASIVAEAKGPILINPFAPSASGSLGDVDRLSGRILNGGRVLKDLPLRLRLATPSHSRAGTIVSALNTRFPREPT
jgi:flagellar basal body P-ring protein FlgI